MATLNLEAVPRVMGGFNTELGEGGLHVSKGPLGKLQEEHI